MDLKSEFLKIVNKIVDFIYPHDIYCINCGNLIDSSRIYNLCDSCIKTFHWTLEPLCQDAELKDHLFAGGFSCVEYGEDERKLIHKFKYKEEAYLYRPMAEAMWDRVKAEPIKMDIVLPIPMFRKKEMTRGYNQAHLLAKLLAKKMEVKYVKNLLFRTEDTLPMNSLSPEERKENIKGAIALNKNLPVNLEDKNILLVDDVFTTGSTADECASVILEHWNAKVYVYAFAAVK